MLAVDQGGVPARPRVAGGWCSRESGVQDPDLNNRLVDTAGCVCLRPAHLRAISLSAVATCKLCSAGVRNPSLQVGKSDRKVHPSGPHRVEPAGGAASLEDEGSCLRAGW